MLIKEAVTEPFHAIVEYLAHILIVTKTKLAVCLLLVVNNMDVNNLLLTEREGRTG